MLPCLTGMCILQLVLTGFLAAGVETVTKGKVGQNLTLPCHYSTAQHGTTTTCWGQGNCPLSWCSATIVHTDAQLKIHGQSSKYHLLGDIHQGEMSLTIVNATENDSGTYCCRVEISGLFNDQKTNVQVVIEKDTEQGIRIHLSRDVGYMTKMHLSILLISYNELQQVMYTIPEYQ
ncbi:hypothetical protein JRQ81_002699 [Phrynocephalus forsythii]|uniref:Ig-like domain-containing protein n=1 Tax=Phrynocephalus forsythii TaxID=171643 RepID=A0A9Q0XIT9_9SAUR|nr:hypothetical protein JRQ81_002699 [Phrynocephalus forsythii]